MDIEKKNSGQAYKDTLVDVRRVTKVVKGGRRFSFSACIITGDEGSQKNFGLVGYGHGKAKEVAEARTKATQEARKKMIKIPLNKGTIHHDVIGKSGAAIVILRKAKAGTGVIAGGPMRYIFASLGVHDIVAKSLGSSNVYAMIAATFDALLKLSSPELISKRRTKSVNELYSKTSKSIK